MLLLSCGMPRVVQASTMTPSVRSLSAPAMRVARTAGREKALVCKASKNSKTTTSVEVAPSPLQVRSRFARSPKPSCVCGRNDEGCNPDLFFRAPQLARTIVSSSHVHHALSPVHPRGTHRLSQHRYLKMRQPKQSVDVGISPGARCHQGSRRIATDRDGSRRIAADGTNVG
jgi:hypothetical protein